jgi:hypothetical protein
VRDNNGRERNGDLHTQREVSDMSSRTSLEERVEPQSTRAEEREGSGKVLPSIPSLLGSLVLGVAALGWVALWFIDRGDCERDGVVLTCTSGAVQTEINLFWSAVLTVAGVVLVLRAVIGLVTRLRAVLSGNGPVRLPSGPPLMGPSDHALPPAGWLRDPEDPETLRFWDGSRWTDARAPVADGHEEPDRG